jgi:polyphosphate kinase 2
MDEFDGKAYRKALRQIEEELNRMHHWLQHTGQRLVVVFEGRDAAGKGGAIGVFTGCLNPRSCRVVALPKPSDRERTQWYFQRYVQHLPSAGEIVLFDRSWYNRAGVERVMGFCSEEEYQRFLLDCPAFERMLVASGILLRKYWLGCDQARQLERFRERIEDPVKRWKISPVDLAACDRYEAYTRARNRMFEATNIPEAPWYLVDMNDQKRGRLNLAKHLLDSLPDHDIGYETIELPALAKKPAKETWPRGVAKVKSVY